ncbi:hypothetical protein LCGC14_0816560 [marine sediment metagenome]|uniref:Uncharacterized protein n=1 Tax=marine sediment metagenome TaxID=412755 RepID=A0A0F9PPR2_9ZZZZ
MPLYETETVRLESKDSDGNDEWVKVREIGVEQLREADAAGTVHVTDQMRMLPEKLVEDEIAKQKAEGTKEREQRFEAYDPATLLKYGVMAWSFKEGDAPIPCDAEHITDMGNKLGDKCARAIYALTVRDSGEGSSSSTKSRGAVSQPPSSERTTSAVAGEGSR